MQRRPEQSSPIGVIHSVTLDDISYSAPALASWQGRIFLAWTGGDDRICVQTSADGHHFSEPVSLVYESYGPRPADRHTRKSRLGSRAPFPLPGDLALRRSPTFPWAPALAATEYGVDMGWRDPDRRIRILRASPDGEPREIILPETSAVAPSIAGLGRNLSLAWTGWDGHINVAGSHDESFHPKVRLEHTSADSPALCSVDGGLALAWTGTDRHINIDVTGSGSFSHPQRLEETSNEGPAIGALGRRIALAWTGADDHVNIAVMHDRTSRSEGVRLDWTTFYSPAITAHGGHFVLAWTAPDGRISLAALQI